MAQYALSSYPDVEQFRILSDEQRTVSFRYEILNGYDGSSKGFFTDIQPGGTISYNSLNTIKRTASFTVVENITDDITRINFLSDYIQVHCDFKFEDTSGQQTLSFPLGVFVLSSNTRASKGRIITRAVEGFDLAQVLASDLTPNRFEVATGIVITNEIRGQLSLGGIANIDISDSPEVMPATRSWDIGTSRLQIVNDLLAMIGYGSLWFDGNGVAQGHDYVAPSERVASISYITDDRSVISDEIGTEIDLFNVPNKWTGVVSNPNQATLVATYQNNNPDSPTSIQSRGRVVSSPILSDLEATNQSQLLSLVKKRAVEDSQIYESVNFKTLLMPIHGDSEIVYLQYLGDNTDSESDTGSILREGSNYAETEWQITLDSSSFMTHRVRRIVSVEQL